MSSRRKRRPANWFTVLETSAAQWSVAVSTIIVMVVIGIVLWQLGGSAALLSNTTTTGGDTAAHYLMPQVLSHFLQSGHLTGWYSGWYDGLPLYSFYFVLPDLFVAVASHVIPYNVAFKLATAMGSILLPLACYGLAKGFKLRRPFPELFAAASLLVLFEQSYTIDGGNLYSTMAGEYSYSLSLALVVGFLGLAASGLRSGRRYVAASILLAAALAAHALPIFTAMLGLGLLVLFDLVNPGHLDDDGLGLLRRRGMKPRSRRTRASVVRWAASVCALGFSAMAWWLLPFVANQRYANPMGYVNAADPGSLLWPGGDRWAVWLVGVGVVVAFSLRSRVGIFLVVMTIESGAAVVLDPQGSIYNTRLLPPYFLFLYLSAAWTFGVLGVNVATGIRQWRMARFAARPLERRRPRDRRVAPGALSVGLLGSALAATVVLGALPQSQNFINQRILGPINSVFGTHLLDDAPIDSVGGWAAYNYSGMEARGESWVEFQGIMAAARHVGDTTGCGRMFWEYESNQSRFGSTMALMLLPKATNGCIDSQEGLLFESSATTPYHFLNQSELSVAGSRAQVGLPYRNTDVADGITHLALLGVRYYLVSDPSLVAAARHDHRLVDVAHTAAYPQSDGTSLTWHIFEIRTTTLVEPLTHLPVVVPQMNASAPQWLQASVPWYVDPSRWGTFLAANGPASWPRGTAATDRSPAVPATSISKVVVSSSGISFSATRLGTPVLVKVSYFPNWHVAGALGPYRVTPNLMVVVPTAHRVTLTYGATTANTVGSLITVASLLTMVLVGMGTRRRAALRRLVQRR